ncbi:MAG: hypothetical protein V7L14_29315 [Nostoc sp.]|uniref:hypothetical protein n=1 Tax=Nostoc sp. TaxID=1180 RepID=UPI002FF6CB52
MSLSFAKGRWTWLPLWEMLLLLLYAQELKSRLPHCLQRLGLGDLFSSKAGDIYLMFGWCVSTFGSWVEFVLTAATSIHFRHGAMSSLHSLFASFCIEALSDWRYKIYSSRLPARCCVSLG